MKKVQPEAYRALDALDTYVKNTSIERLDQELIRIRASQINGCAYCVHSHSADAIQHGARWEKLQLISVWREAPNVFSEEEQVLLKMTEEITRINEAGLKEETYNKAIAILGEKKTAEVIMVIIAINSWNRIGVGLEMHPEL